MSFGARLRILRSAAGLTQEELAERAGLTATGVSALERGTRTRPYPHTARALAAALGLDGADLDEFVAMARYRSAAAPPDAGAVEEAPPTSSALVGRDREIEELSALLRGGHRLVTLTGPGGVGKTTLAVETARRVAPAFAGDTDFVGLASLTDPSQVEPVLAGRVGVPSSAGAAERVLLVVDNFEHVLAAAPAVAALVADRPHLSVLVTSRAPLRLRGERELQVRPLALPASARAPSAEEVLASPSGRLFVDRARLVQPGFAVTPATAADVAAICRRLGGLPLAIELAAAKVRVLAPGALLQRLDVAMSSGWARDLPPRQHTLRSTLEWSYRLLGDDEQLLLRRLSVFAGGFLLEDVEALVGPLLGRHRVLPVLERLVEHSLVVVVPEPDGAVGYALLEPVREYARDLLRDSGQEQEARDQHAAYFLEVAERTAAGHDAADHVAWRDRSERESENMRAAMSWALSTGAGEVAARLGWALWLPWWTRGQFDEGRRCMESALELDMPAPVRTRALVVHASMVDAQGDLGTAEELWRRAAQGADRDDVAGRAYGLAGMGLAAMTRDPQHAGDLLTEAVSLAEQAGDPWLVTLATVWLGDLARDGGDPARAEAYFTEALSAARQRGDRMLTSVALLNLAQGAMAGRDDLAAAERCAREGLLVAAGMGHDVNTALALDLLAAAATRREAWHRGAVLLGAADRLRHASGRGAHIHYPFGERLRDRARCEAESALGAAAFQESLREGGAMDLAAAVRYATETEPAASVGASRAPAPARPAPPAAMS